MKESTLGLRAAREFNYDLLALLSHRQRLRSKPLSGLTQFFNGKKIRGIGPSAEVLQKSKSILYTILAPVHLLHPILTPTPLTTTMVHRGLNH